MVFRNSIRQRPGLFRALFSATVLTLLIAGLPGTTFAFSSGAPSCADAISCMGAMQIESFVLEVIDPMTGNVLPTVPPGAQVDIRIRTADGSDWRGLLLQSSVASGFTQNPAQTSGVFSAPPSGFKLGPCPSDSSVTQSTRFNGSSVDFPWTAPAQPGTVNFVGQFVVTRFNSENSLQIFSVEVAEAAAGPGDIENTLMVDRSQQVPGDLALSWQQSCSTDAVDYAIYEGTLGDFTSHVQIDCSDDAGDRIEEITPSPGNTYYLLVAIGGSDEGSYGVDSAGQERPSAALPQNRCLETQLLDACP
ncbi:hypothetical protein ABI59_17865 [Acidobacteria bacterium Mor1]|nr:hypothetical protein ABI59_17865 [Acidobacteria bacterium Mor1]